jgi:hypothetical protein
MESEIEKENFTDWTIELRFIIDKYRIEKNIPDYQIITFHSVALPILCASMGVKKETFIRLIKSISQTYKEAVKEIENDRKFENI